LQIISLKPIEYKDKVTGIRFYKRANYVEMAGSDPHIVVKNKSDLVLGAFSD